MNVSGKSLQDIYDAGSARLEDLEKSQKSSLSATCDAHFEEKSSSEPESLKDLEESSQQLEAEIRSCLSQGLERVEKTVRLEIEDNQQYIGRLVESLGLLAKKFSESIKQLKDSTEFGIKDLSFDCEEQFRRHNERVKSDLHKQGLFALEQLKTEGMSSVQGVSEKVEESLQQEEEQENEIKNRLFSAFVSYIGSVKTSLSDSLSRLTDVFSEKGAQTAARAGYLEQEANEYADRLLESAESHAADSQTRLKEAFLGLLQQCNLDSEQSASEVISQLRSQHDAGMAELNDRTRQLHRDMDELSESVSQAVAFRDQEIRSQAESAMGSFGAELRERVESGENFRRELEEERAKVVEGIWDELSAVQSRFEEKMAALARSTLEQLQNICSEAETAISSAQELCVSESRSNASSRQDVIEAAARDFLDCVSQRRASALDGIAAAAGAGGATEDAPDEEQGTAKEEKKDEGISARADREKEGKSASKEQESLQASSGPDERKARIARAIEELDETLLAPGKSAEDRADTQAVGGDPPGDLDVDEDESSEPSLEPEPGANPRPGDSSEQSPRKRPGRRNSPNKSNSDKRSGGDSKR